jgi:glucan phosphoethanolaminetransferase (alkaline phosphatase superfamily)
VSREKSAAAYKMPYTQSQHTKAIVPRHFASSIPLLCSFRGLVYCLVYRNSQVHENPFKIFFIISAFILFSLELCWFRFFSLSLSLSPPPLSLCSALMILYTFFFGKILFNVHEKAMRSWRRERENKEPSSTEIFLCWCLFVGF